MFCVGDGGARVNHKGDHGAVELLAMRGTACDMGKSRSARPSRGRTKILSYNFAFLGLMKKDR